MGMQFLLVFGTNYGPWLLSKKTRGNKMEKFQSSLHQFLLVFYSDMEIIISGEITCFEIE